MKKVHLSISNPCQERWDEMTPQEEGRFCRNCQKTVVDFTEMSDIEVLNFFKKNQEHACGRFAKKQLNKTYVQPQPSLIPKWIKTGLVATGIMTATSIEARQLKESIHVVDNQLTKIPLPILNQESTHDLSQHPQVTTDSIMIIKGVITDESSEPLIGVSVLLKGTTIGTATDFDGYYELHIPITPEQKPSVIISYSYIGFENKDVSFENIQQLSIVQNVVLDSPIAFGEMGIIVINTNRDRTIGQYINRWLSPVKRGIRNWIIDYKERRAAKKRKILTKSIEESVIPAVQNLEGKPEFTNTLLFPNPFTENLHLKYNSEKDQEIHITITDINGKIVFSKKEPVIKGENSIELIPDLPNGNYWLRLVTEDQEVETQAISRIVKY